MALTQQLLAPTVDASVNVVVIDVPAGSTATVAAYTALGGQLPDLPAIEITHKNPAGTFQNTGFWLGASPNDQQMPQFILGPGSWSINKPPTAVPVGFMLDS
jgi:hypothetical protein